MLLTFACCVLHVAMDYFTIGGGGIMLLWPLTTARFMPPWPLFYGLHWSNGLFASSHWITLGSELAFVLVLFGALHLLAGTGRTAGMPWRADEPRGG